MGIPGRIGTTRPFAEIARGTTTSVYKAYDEDADGIVAVKLLHQRWLPDAALASRFLAEAGALRSVSHEHVVSILQSGECDAGLFIVTEFVEGSTLDALLRQRTVPSAFALLTIRDAAAGLAAAHNEGIVHRDFKPANIIVSEAGIVKLADFGLAGTTQDAVAGTPDYLAPEVVAGHPATTASDVFSLGVSLFEVLAGGLPVAHSRGTKSATFQIHRAGDALLAALDDEERALVQVLTSPLPEDRPDDASAVVPLIDTLLRQFDPTPDANVFADWLSRTDGDASLAVPRRTRTPGVFATSSASTVVGVATDQTPIKPGSRVFRVGIAAAVVLLVASVAFFAWRSTRPSLSGDTSGDASVAESTAQPIVDNPATPTTTTTTTTTPTTTPRATPPASTPATPPATASNSDIGPATDNAENDGAPVLTGSPDESTNTADSATTIAGNEQPNQPAASEIPAFLSVAASPWAEVLVDGVSLGTTPISAPVAIEPGPRDVVLRHPDFPDYTRRVEAVATDTIALSVSMWSTVARLNLTVSPWAVVMIDETVRDTTPIRSDLIVRPGPANLTLLHPTLGSWSTALDLRADSTYMMRFNLFELTRQ